MYLDRYIDALREKGNVDLACAAQNTADEVWDKHLSSFTYNQHITGLLFGNVQSGKTSHMFSVISKMADNGFKIFILMTTDNVYLQKQTYDRTCSDLSNLNVCHEDEYIKFLNNKMSRPSVIVLKKNTKILKRWFENLASTGYCNGNPIVIIDDEGDAASPNTLINSNSKSTINRNLEWIKNLSTSSIYLQVTGTPQALLLQTQQSGWKPSFIYYFEPGKSYLGGNFFFLDDPISNSIALTEDSELSDLLHDDEFAVNGLAEALLYFLLVTAHSFVVSHKKVSNFVIHPSHKIGDHEKIAEKLGDYLNNILIEITEDQVEEIFKEHYDKLKLTKIDLISFELAIEFVKKVLSDGQVAVKVMNSNSGFTEFVSGINIVVGGNSLGRGITFPQLNTVYYSRSSKSPQADTVWQHARMFGYDRDKELIKIFMPHSLYRVFVSINNVNNALIKQVKSGKNEVKMFYPSNVRPTRKQVIDSKKLICISGGTNYFPYSPVNNTIEKIDSLLSVFDESKQYYYVDIRVIIKILELVQSESIDEWNTNDFISFATALGSTEPGKQAVLIVRRNRDIARGTGTLLSPTDRALGTQFKDETVLTMYKVNGTKGWNNKQLWIPNIKFPKDFIFYDID